MIVKPTKTIRRADDNNQCSHERRANHFWGCEREKGHAGPHLAWTNYQDGVLYEGGCWNDDDEDVNEYPRPSKDSCTYAFYVGLLPPTRRTTGHVVNIDLPDGRRAYLRIVSHGRRSALQALNNARPPRKGETLLNTHEL